jgi:hypothetical protein
MKKLFLLLTLAGCSPDSKTDDAFMAAISAIDSLQGVIYQMSHADSMRTQIYNSGFNVHLDSIDYYFPKGEKE